jgi:hypothetical protein
MNYKKMIFSKPYVWLLVDSENKNSFPAVSRNLQIDNIPRGKIALVVTREPLLAKRQTELQVDIQKQQENLKNSAKKEIPERLALLCRSLYKKFTTPEFLSKLDKIKPDFDAILFDNTYLPITEQGRIQANSRAGKNLYPITAFGVCSNAIKAYLIGGIDPGDPGKVAQWVSEQTRK